MRDLTLTVLLPVYNGERYLAETIDSVLAQSHRDFEFLIIDDGSTDSTPQILERYAKGDSRVRLLRHENQGVGLTKNRGIQEATGDLIAEIGADDLMLPGRLEAQMRFFRENVGYVLCGGSLRIIDESGRATGIRNYPTTNRALRRAMLLYNPFGGPAVMYRRTLAIAAGGFTPRFWTCEDYDFVLRLAKHGGVANLPESLTAYRLHSGATKATQTLRQLRDTLAVKKAAVIEYGYRDSLGARLVNLAQTGLLLLPPRATYWLFRRLAIRSL